MKLIGLMAFAIILATALAQPADADSFPQEFMRFENLDDSYGAKISRVYCCSQKDGKVVIAFERISGSTVGEITANAIVNFNHTHGSGEEITLLNAKVTKFVEFGEVRYAVKPKYKGTYDVRMEFFHGESLVGVAQFRQIK